MRALIQILFLAALTACGSAVRSANDSQVLIRYHNFADSPDSVRPMAEAHCTSFDRLAVYQRSSLGEGVFGFLTGLPVIAEFDCRAPITLSGIQVKPPEPSSQVTVVSRKLPEPASQVTELSPKPAEQPMFAVHLSSLQDILGIETEWQELLLVFPDLLADRELIVRSVNLPEQGTFYRLSAGRFRDHAKAQDFCAQIKARRRYCLAHRLKEEPAE